MNQLFRYLTGHAEVVLFVGVFADQIGLPMPSVPVLLAAGALVANGTMNPFAALLIVVVASVLADLLWFYIGRRGGDRLLRMFSKSSFCGDANLSKAERCFTHHGDSAIFGAKFLPWLGFVIPPLAGALGIKLGRFLRFDVLGSLIYGVFYVGLGFLFDRELSLVLDFFGRIGMGGLALIALGAVLILSHHRVQQRKSLTPAPAPSTEGAVSVPRL